MGKEPLGVARLHALEQGVELEYRQITAEAHADEAPGQYDVVTCMEMLEHVPDPASVLRAIATLVRPGKGVRLHHQPQPQSLSDDDPRGRVPDEDGPQGHSRSQEVHHPAELCRMGKRRASWCGT